jgi:hypothetical protein
MNQPVIPIVIEDEGPTPSTEEKGCTIRVGWPSHLIGMRIEVVAEIGKKVEVCGSGTLVQSPTTIRTRSLHSVEEHNAATRFWIQEENTDVKISETVETWVHPSELSLTVDHMLVGTLEIQVIDQSGAITTEGITAHHILFPESARQKPTGVSAERLSHSERDDAETVNGDTRNRFIPLPNVSTSDLLTTVLRPRSGAFDVRVGCGKSREKLSIPAGVSRVRVSFAQNSYVLLRTESPLPEGWFLSRIENKGSPNEVRYPVPMRPTNEHRTYFTYGVVFLEYDGPFGSRMKCEPSEVLINSPQQVIEVRGFAIDNTTAELILRCGADMPVRQLRMCRTASPESPTPILVPIDGNGIAKLFGFPPDTYTIWNPEQSPYELSQEVTLPSGATDIALNLSPPKSLRVHCTEKYKESELRSGDLILGINGERFGPRYTVFDYVKQLRAWTLDAYSLRPPPEEPVRLIVRRGGEIVVMRCTPASLISRELKCMSSHEQ